MSRPIRVLVDRAAMSQNLGRVFDLLRQSSIHCPSMPKVWAVIKADAYGHGIETAVDAFAQADGLAMLDFSEAVRCRKAGWTKPILMLEGVFDRDDLEACVEWGLWPVVHEAGQIALLQKTAIKRPVAVFLKLDTGMHRLGFEPQDYGQAYSALLQLQSQGKVASIAHMTHFACADEPDGIRAPLKVFRDTVGNLPGDRCVANSAAILRHTPEILSADFGSDSGIDIGTDSGADPRTDPDTDQARHTGYSRWVRPGICLYGASPLSDLPASQMGFRASMTLVSKVLSVRMVRAGEGIGYSYIYRAPRDMRVAVVACGYADGYPRHAPSGTPIVVNGQRAALAGRVSMDMLTVDVSGLSTVQVGDEVILWGEGGPGVDEVAHASGTIGYELLTAVTPRVQRVFV